MSRNLTSQGLQILIEELADFLQRLFEGNGQDDLDVKDFPKILLTQTNLTIKEVIEIPFSDLKIKLDRINTNVLDHLVIFLYQTTNKKYETHKLLKEHLYNRIMELIIYLELNRKEFSLERNNIKNSLGHRVKNY